MNRPHSVVPQNFQTRGGWSGIAGGTATALAGVRESIRWLSRSEIDVSWQLRAVHGDPETVNHFRGVIGKS